MDCDPSLVNHKISVGRECVDMEDVALTKFVKPQSGVKDTIKSNQEIALYVKNLSPTITYEDLIIRARIEDMNKNLLQPEFSGVLPTLEPLDSVLYTFPTKYEVPNVSDYIVRVFITKVDNYQDNDTIWTKRETQEVGITTSNFDVFSLGQNIPNPAKNSTKIEYSVPSSGEVIFNVQSVSGQILYTKTIQSEVGKHAIELNTSDLAAGIYFYSVEYKGQKLVKRMSVKN
jgi:hypothetical protein